MLHYFKVVLFDATPFLLAHLILHYITVVALCDVAQFNVALFNAEIF